MFRFGKNVRGEEKFLRGKWQCFISNSENVWIVRVDECTKHRTVTLEIKVCLLCVLSNTSIYENPLGKTIVLVKL